ncbi:MULTISPECIES: rhodanese-like domain-containing protein [unclassified Streptomyces]|uniref:rhodanese-like domain-containing protein n=1 Tax=unclassified Streptomyces TaxID=2593676 RepID=UPI00236661B3|nr:MULTISPECIES: rhodanese-like domain-containing protein [unclassified Streptomyces]MDF3142355.1 rhodanese-like domain-containing protein [Streptomyces sp. T21Q-yed]WDF40121.1 rhodanese-like domain-containing protein [Streptomyces sp. T12]
MSEAVKDKVAEYLETATGKPVDLDPLPDDTPLNTLGLDSLLTISVLVTLLEDCGVDLGEHADSLVTPSTLGDLYAVAARFMADEDATPDDSGMSREQRSQLDYYQEKLAYETDAADLKAALEDGQDLVVVDGRSSEAYEREHIPGAISIPHRSISQDSLAGLSKSPLYVAYCDGIGCNASTKTAIKLATAGFRVKELLGGLDWWKRDGYATEGTHASQCDVHAHVDCGCAG